MTGRAAAAAVLALAAAGCGERTAVKPTPRAGTPTPPATVEPRRVTGPAAACVSEGAPFAVRRGTVASRRGTALTWSPPPSRCLRPLVVYSHGHNGAPSRCGALCPALARAGFLVVAPRHRDGAAFAQESAARRADIRDTLDHLPLRHDRGRIALTGHSFGGYTAAEVGAADRRVKAVVALAGTPGFASMSVLPAPVLIAAGTRDDIETVESSRAADEAVPPGVPHRLLVIEGARHGDLLRSARVRRAATAFLREHLLG